MVIIPPPPIYSLKMNKDQTCLDDLPRAASGNVVCKRKAGEEQSQLSAGVLRVPAPVDRVKGHFRAVPSAEAGSIGNMDKTQLFHLKEKCFALWQRGHQLPMGTLHFCEMAFSLLEMPRTAARVTGADICPARQGSILAHCLVLLRRALVSLVPQPWESRNAVSPGGSPGAAVLLIA